MAKISGVSPIPASTGTTVGPRSIASALCDAGVEVIYTSLHHTPEQIVEALPHEDVDAVGPSTSSTTPSLPDASRPR